MVTDEQKVLKIVKNKAFQSLYMQLVNNIIEKGKGVKRKKGE